MSTCPDELRHLYRAGRIIPFVGAGATMSVSWGDTKNRKRGPSWEEVVAQAAKLLDADPALLRVRGTDLQILEYFKIINAGLTPLINWLALQLSGATDEDVLESPIHAQLVKLDKCGIYYTTNYDNFIERALKKVGRNARPVSAEHNIIHDPTIVEVVKFHGDLNFPDKMVLSESEYLDRMRLESAMDMKLRSDMLGRAALFIGYSFRDPNVAYIFHLINRLFANLPDSYSGRRAYIVLPDPSEFERKLFHIRNIEVISIRGARISDEVGGLLEAMRS